jgi:tripartite-type tricarboxylate transporter receptor subunit TctC
MKLPRRQFLHLTAVAAALPTVSPLAWAQGYPSHPVTMVVAAPAGGGSDAVGRVVAEGMRGSLGQPIIIQNVSGADGSVGTGRVARARPDGYTIQLGITSTHMMNGAVYPLPYDVVADFAPISLLAKRFKRVPTPTRPASQWNHGRDPTATYGAAPPAPAPASRGVPPGVAEASERHSAPGWLP